jgi:hypothetical protein
MFHTVKKSRSDRDRSLVIPFFPDDLRTGHLHHPVAKDIFHSSQKIGEWRTVRRLGSQASYHTAALGNEDFFAGPQKLFDIGNS